MGTISAGNVQLDKAGRKEQPYWRVGEGPGLSRTTSEAPGSGLRGVKGFEATADPVACPRPIEGAVGLFNLLSGGPSEPE